MKIWVFLFQLSFRYCREKWWANPPFLFSCYIRCPSSFFFISPLRTTFSSVTISGENRNKQEKGSRNFCFFPSHATNERKRVFITIIVVVMDLLFSSILSWQELGALKAIFANSNLTWFLTSMSNLMKNFGLTFFQKLPDWWLTFFIKIWVSVFPINFWIFLQSTKSEAHIILEIWR